MAKGNPRLTIRLDEKHWIWQINDKELRNEEIRKALDFYHNFYKDIELIKRNTNKINDLESDIKEIKKKGVAVKAETKEKEENKSKIDPRLIKSMNNFLDF